MELFVHKNPIVNYLFFAYAICIYVLRHCWCLGDYFMDFSTWYIRGFVLNAQSVHVCSSINANDLKWSKRNLIPFKLNHNNFQQKISCSMNSIISLVLFGFLANYFSFLCMFLVLADSPSLSIYVYRELVGIWFGVCEPIREQKTLDEEF